MTFLRNDKLSEKDQEAIRLLKNIKAILCQLGQINMPEVYVDKETDEVIFYHSHFYGNESIKLGNIEERMMSLTEFVSLADVISEEVDKYDNAFSTFERLVSLRLYGDVVRDHVVADRINVPLLFRYALPGLKKEMEAYVELICPDAKKLLKARDAQQEEKASENRQPGLKLAVLVQFMRRHQLLVEHAFHADDPAYCRSASPEYD